MLFIFDIVILVISHFDFEGGTLVLIASVPDHCLLYLIYGPMSKFVKFLVLLKSFDTQLSNYAMIYLYYG